MTLSDLVHEFDKILALFSKSVIEFLPNILAAVLFLLIGFMIASIVRSLCNRFIKKIDRLIPGKKIHYQIQPARLERSAQVISNIFYWIIIFFFLTAATETIGLPVVTTWLSGIASYLPKILAAVLICLAGIIGSVLLRDLISTTAESAGILHSRILGRICQYTILLITILVGVEQLDIDITFLTNVILICVFLLLFGAVLAFALGARTSVNNILGSFYLQRLYKVGQTVRIGDSEGQITQITPIAVILDTADGRVYIPAGKFNELISTLISE